MSSPWTTPLDPMSSQALFGEAEGDLTGTTEAGVMHCQETHAAGVGNEG